MNKEYQEKELAVLKLQLVIFKTAISSIAAAKTLTKLLEGIFMVTTRFVGNSPWRNSTIFIR